MSARPHGASADKSPAVPHLPQGAGRHTPVQFQGQESLAGVIHLIDFFFDLMSYTL